MSILIVVPDDRLGGAEQFLKMLATYYLEKNEIVYVFFLKKSSENGWGDLFQFENLKLQYGVTNYDLFGFLGLFYHLIRLNKIKFQFVFTSHTYITGIIGAMIKVKLIKKSYFVGRESTAIFNRFSGVKLLILKILYKIGFFNLDLLICQTEEMKRQLVNGMPSLKIKIKIKVIENPIDLNRIKLFEKENINTNIYGNYIIGAGRLIYLKGFDLLIKSIRKLQDQSINLILLGEGEEKGKLVTLINNLNLNTKVHLLGKVDNVYPYFKNAKACVVSSRIEGFPNVLLQMMSQSNSVVSTTCAGGIKDIPGLFTCNVDCVNELSKTIDYALSDPNIGNRIVFNDYLKSRTISNFVIKMERYLNNC
ncbi:glycosyltransferase [uncultured Maribacter sp.]|uniref:glycosyltransferase n=1 Tax=uncultured Maribacter sp. TaxID=431308 RepID=UPI0026332021|nr:glycosyltransferase [uncultured Maribacter sp.]